MRTVLQVFVFDLMAKLLLAVFGLLLIRHLPASAFADYTFATSLANVAAGLLTASFNRIYIVGYDQLGLRGRVSSFLTFQFLLVALLIALTLPFWRQGPLLYWSLVAFVLGNCLYVFATTFMQREERFALFSGIKITHGALLLLGFLLLLQATSGAGAANALGLRAVIMMLVFVVFVGWRLDLRGLFSLPAAAQTLRRVFAEGYGQLFVYHAISAIFANVNILLLRRLVDDHDLAAFGSAYRYYLLLFLASSALKSVFLPQVQNANTAVALRGIFKRHRLMIAAYVPVVAIAALLAQWAIPLVDQGRYPEAVTVFRILCVSTVLSFAFSAYMTLLMKHRRFRLLIVLITVGVVFNLVVSYVLIVGQGIVGAAIATVLAYGGFNFAVFVSARSTLRAATGTGHGDHASDRHDGPDAGHRGAGS